MSPVAAETRRRRALALALLVLAVVAVYSPVVTHGFLSLDDHIHTYGNPVVMEGLRPAGLRWALTTFHGSNWQPVTWFAHMLDAQLFGDRAGGHHLTSLLLHAANTLALALLLEALTGRLWPAVLAAALFGLHPLHVESVAWVSEKKDLLFTLGIIGSTAAWARWTRRGGGLLYALSLGAFALALAAKAMAVTLPALLLLLDWWPLGRAAGPGAPLRRWSRLAAEKAPFFALSAASALATVAAQRAGGAVLGVEEFTLAHRLALPGIAYVFYLAKTVWPAGLALFYPVPEGFFPGWQSAGAALAVAAVSAGALRARRSAPYAAVGWAWYLVALLPVIGVIKVGDQFAADRFTYVPLIGVFVALAWGGAALWRASSTARPALLGAAVLAVAGSAWQTGQQLPYWRDDVAAFERAAAVQPESWLLRAYLGTLYAARGRHAEAVRELEAGAAGRPDDAEVRAHLGSSLNALGRFGEAAGHLARAVELDPGLGSAWMGLAFSRSRQGRHGDAVEALRAARRLDPEAEAVNLGLAGELDRDGRRPEAVALLEGFLRGHPGARDAARALGRLRGGGPDSSP